MMLMLYSLKKAHYSAEVRMKDTKMAELNATIQELKIQGKVIINKLINLI